MKGHLLYYIYGKCPKISNLLFHIFLAKILHFMKLLLKVLSGMENSVDPDQTAPSGSADLCHFVRHFGARKFRIFYLYIIFLQV